MTGKKIILTALLAILAALLAYALYADKPKTEERNDNASGRENPRQSDTSAFAEKTNSEGTVTIKVTPQNISGDAESWDFKISLDTHSGDLTDDLTAVSLLSDEKGKEFKPISWVGDPPSGHHREGILKFDPISPKPESITLKINQVGGVEKRIFLWITSP